MSKPTKSQVGFVSFRRTYLPGARGTPLNGAPGLLGFLGALKSIVLLVPQGNDGTDRGGHVASVRLH